LSFADEKDGGQRRRTAPPPEDGSLEAEQPKKKRRASPEVGHALRAAYQRTIDEEIPPDLLDLLGKLG
jgi:hypothetical protein